MKKGFLFCVFHSMGVIFQYNECGFKKELKPSTQLVHFDPGKTILKIR